MPPFVKRQARRKFYRGGFISEMEQGRGGRGRTKSVIAREYKTRMKRNLKKWAASCARPAIQ